MRRMKASQSLDEMKKIRLPMPPLESRRQSFTGTNQQRARCQQSQDKNNQCNLSLIQYAFGRINRQKQQQQQSVHTNVKLLIHVEPTPMINTSIVEVQKYINEKAESPIVDTSTRIQSNVHSKTVDAKGNLTSKKPAMASNKVEEPAEFLTFGAEDLDDEDNDFAPKLPKAFPFETNIAALAQSSQRNKLQRNDQISSNRSIMSYLESSKTEEEEDHTSYGIDNEYDPKLLSVNTNKSGRKSTATTIPPPKPAQPFVVKLTNVIDKKKRILLPPKLSNMSSSNVEKKTTLQPPTNKIKQFLQPYPNKVERSGGNNTNQYTIFNDPELFEAMNHSFISFGGQGSMNFHDESSSLYLQDDNSERDIKSYWITNRRFEC